MEFPFNVNALLTSRVTVVRGGVSKPNGIGRTELEKIVNDMGVASAKAQGLKAPITSYNKLQQSIDQCIYLLRADSTFSNSKGALIGFIKTGRKRLFLTDSKGILHEVEPLCILDFYVHESQQRRGYGKVLFEEVLQHEGLEPFEIAIDQPSPKFLSFLRKHYNLHSYVKQSNNFVVFDKFFSTCVHIDYGQRKYKRNSLPKYGSVSHTHFNNSRVSLSPKRSEWQFPSSHNNLTEPLPLTTNSPVTCSPIATTSTPNVTSEITHDTSRHTLSPWNPNKLTQLQFPTPQLHNLQTQDIYTVHSRAPHLNMRTRNRNRPLIGYSNVFPTVISTPHNVQYSRYNTRIEHNSDRFGTKRNQSDTKGYSIKHWKSFLY